MPPSLVGADGIKIEEVREVVKTLKEGNLDEKEKAAKALDRLLQAHPLQRKENARAVYKMSIVPAAVALLKDGTANGQMYAAGILACIAEDNAEYRSEIVKAGGINPLVSLLRAGSANAQEMAAGAVASVSEDPANQKALSKAGAIPQLAAQLHA